MYKVAFLISYIPSPRILKRIKAIEANYLLTIIYWDRNLPNKEDFDINSKNKVIRISISAPMGRPLLRFIPFLKFFNKSFRYLKEIRPDVIHVENIDMLTVATWYKNRVDRNVKIIYEIADLPAIIFQRESKIVTKKILADTFVKFETTLLKSVDQLILTSPYFWEYYYKRYLPCEKYLFIPNAPSRLVFEKYHKKTISDTFTVGYFGAVRYVEQLKLLIDAVKQINENIEIVIAGNGIGYETIRKYTAKMDFVRMYGPYNFEREIAELYSKVDCVYCVYDTQVRNVQVALPNKLYEAIVCELPIIVSKNTVLGDFVQKENVGVVVKDNDINELKGVIKMLKDDCTYVKDVAEKCREIKDMYYNDEHEQKLIDVYDQILLNKVR